METFLNEMLTFMNHHFTIVSFLESMVYWAVLPIVAPKIKRRWLRYTILIGIWVLIIVVESIAQLTLAGVVADVYYGILGPIGLYGCFRFIRICYYSDSNLASAQYFKDCFFYDHFHETEKCESKAGKKI